MHLVFQDEKQKQTKKLIVLKYIFSTFKTLVLSSVKCGNAILTWHLLKEFVYLLQESGICSILRQHFQNHTVGVLLDLLM